jgi:hypothetical protein
MQKLKTQTKDKQTTPEAEKKTQAQTPPKRGRYKQPLPSRLRGDGPSLPPPKTPPAQAPKKNKAESPPPQDPKKAKEERNPKQQQALAKGRIPRQKNLPETEKEQQKEEKFPEEESSDDATESDEDMRQKNRDRNTGTKTPQLPRRSARNLKKASEEENLTIYITKDEE